MGSGESSLKDDSARRKFEGVEAIAGVVAGVALLAGTVAAVMSASGNKTNRKTMKAPGRDGQIFRDDFVGDPKGYFRNLRKK